MKGNNIFTLSSMAQQVLMYLMLLASLLSFGAPQVIICPTLVTCSQCISTASCVWCSTPGNARCLSQENANSCRKDDLLQPATTIIDKQEIPLTENNQVSLKSIDLKLRVNESVSFSVSLKAAQNFPLDLYMLMDLSFSFESDLETVKVLAPQLPLALRNVSSDFLIGFGTFVDKPSLPYTSSVQLNKVFNNSGQPSSCGGQSLCTKPFNYEHVISLTNSSDLFNSSVQETIISTNVDDPEDPLGPMLQAVVCKELIEWRETSIKILLVMTDDVLHTAGDGYLAGIVKPNDGQCHTQYDPVLNKTLYTESLTQDYPSIEQVRQALEDANIVPVFAVPLPSSNLSEKILSLYNDTISPLLDSSTVLLSSNSDNLEDVLSEAHANAIADARLSFNIPNYLSANVTASCPPGSTYLQDSNECTDIGNGTVNFTITLTLQQCTESLRNGKSVQIQFNLRPFGQFVAKITGFCDCTCDKEQEYNSTNCNNNGNITCGRCSCFEGWKGNDCSCTTADCPVGPNGITCSGRGQCDCGQCMCTLQTQPIGGVLNPRIVGDACECSNYECDTDSDGVVCSGRGNCTCSNGEFMCVCHNSTFTGLPHTGERCQCSRDNCIDPNGGTAAICSGQGTCDPCEPQGRACTCNDGFTGMYCERSTGSIVAGCNDNDLVRECVKCYANAAKDGGSPTCSGFTCTNYSILSSYPSNSDSHDVDGTIDSSTVECSFTDSTNFCRFVYFVGLSTQERERIYEVPAPRDCLLIPIWAVTLLILVGLVIIGIIILVIIKLIIMYLDHREYQVFQKEVDETDLSKNFNPIYHAPTVTYDNVAYGKE